MQDFMLVVLCCSNGIYASCSDESFTGTRQSLVDPVQFKRLGRVLLSEALDTFSKPRPKGPRISLRYARNSFMLMS